MAMRDKAEEKTKSSGMRTKEKSKRDDSQRSQLLPPHHHSWLPQDNPTPTSSCVSGCSLFPLQMPEFPQHPACLQHFPKSWDKDTVRARWGSACPRSESSTDPWAACLGWINRANDEFKPNFLLPLSLSKVSTGLGMLGVCLGCLCACVWRQKDGFACLVSEM